MRTTTMFMGTPSVSATTCAMQVRVPVPRSCVPIMISTVPSALILARHLEACPRPPQVAMPMPKPRLR